jgi:hypothetical protein
MEFKLESSTDTRTITDTRTFKLDATSSELHTDRNGAKWLPEYAHLEYIRIDGGPWKIRSAWLYGTSVRRDGQRGARKYRQQFIGKPTGKSKWDGFSVLREVIMANWPEED